jgi:hypothetical protein
VTHEPLGPPGPGSPRTPPPPLPIVPDAPPPGLVAMDLGQIVDALIALYRRRPGLLLGLCAVLDVPAAILAAIILLPLPARLEAILGFDPFDPPASFGAGVDLPAASTDQILGFLGPLWLSALVTIVAGALTTIAVASAVTQVRLGRPASFGAAVRTLLRRLAPSLAAFVAYTVAVVGLLLLALVAFAVPLGLAPSASGGGPLAFVAVLAMAAMLVLTLFVSVRWTFWPQAVGLEDRGPIASLGRSWRLVSGSTWRVIGYTLLFGLAAGVLQGLLAQLGLILADVIGASFPESVRLVLRFAVNTLATLLLAPVVPVAMTLLYLDLRVRRGEAPA